MTIPVVVEVPTFPILADGWILTWSRSEDLLGSNSARSIRSLKFRSQCDTR